MLVDEAIHAIESAIGQTIMTGGQIAASKFYSPVSPGDLLSLRFDIRQDKTIVFEIYENKRKIAAGNLKPAETLDLC
jgi:3-hydroxymyristoyl/3-hydroxydecanoyl-(acyl carrier protein) dehydratase